MPTPPAAEPHRQGRDDLAPAAHTAVLIALIVAVAATGTWLTRAGSTFAAPSPAAASQAALYLEMMGVAWGLLFYVCRVGRPRSALRELVGERWTSVGRALGDIGLAAAGWLVVEACEIAWMRLFAAPRGSSVAAMLPHSWMMRVAWAAVSVSVGLSEEVVYRGYVQKQLAAFTGRPTVATVLQAVLFGLAHADRGSATMTRFAVYGLALGALARWRRSLLPGILCHACTNLASGLLQA